MDQFVEAIQEVTKKLCADFDTIKAERKAYTLVNDMDVVHESTGKYVTESTAGFFPDRNVPAFKFISLMDDLLQLYSSKDKKMLAGIEKKFGEALWEGFKDPTNKKSRKKNTSFRQLRKDVKVEDYNELLAQIYDNAVELLKISQQKKDKIGEQVFGSILNLAAVCSDMNAAPYEFDNDYQLKSLDFVEKAIGLKFYVK